MSSNLSRFDSTKILNFDITKIQKKCSMLQFDKKYGFKYNGAYTQESIAFRYKHFLFLQGISKEGQTTKYGINIYYRQ